MVALSFLVAFLLVNRMISSLSLQQFGDDCLDLLLAWLRFFAWRRNIWGEAAGLVLGPPLS